jgi:hypothetical protein
VLDWALVSSCIYTILCTFQKLLNFFFRVLHSQTFTPITNSDLLVTISSIS